MIQKTRFDVLNSNHENENGKFILYWMQAAQRTRWNHALEYGIDLANRKNLPLIVVFGLTDDYPDANLRHYSFMIEGLKDVARNLGERGIPFQLILGNPADVAIQAAEKCRIVVTDDGYTRVQRQWRQRVANEIGVPLVQVVTNVVLPIYQISDKQEYAARTIRPKIQRQLNNYLVDFEHLELKKSSLEKQIELPKCIALDEALNALDLDESVKPVEWITPGETAVGERLRSFVENGIQEYNDRRNDPSLDGQSGLSPYLHFGQLSPLEAAMQASQLSGPGPEAFLEELIVRRELAINFVWHNPDYDTYDGIPDWARKTLEEHRNDPREYLYSFEELEKAQTHDDYWNAAQLEMIVRGKMHGYMRMYWAKKILQWSESPRFAFEQTLELNDKYELDGRDPNGYCGVSWCYGTHDRPWKEREVFGKVRYMAASGLERKFNISSYADAMNGDTLFDSKPELDE